MWHSFYWHAMQRLPPILISFYSFSLSGFQSGVSKSRSRLQFPIRRFFTRSHDGLFWYFFSSTRWVPAPRRNQPPTSGRRSDVFRPKRSSVSGSARRRVLLMFLVLRRWPSRPSSFTAPTFDNVALLCIVFSAKITFNGSVSADSGQRKEPALTSENIADCNYLSRWKSATWRNGWDATRAFVEWRIRHVYSI